MNKKYEYKVIERTTLKEVESMLNMYGSFGWELVGYSSDVVHVMCGSQAFLDVMTEWCGNELTINSIYIDNAGRTGYFMKEPEIQWIFTDGMIDGLAYEPQEKMVSLDDVCKFLEEHLYTGTSTDDYDYGQEYIYSDFDNVSDLIFALRKETVTQRNGGVTL